MNNFIFTQYNDWVRIIYKNHKFISISSIDGLHLWSTPGSWEKDDGGYSIIDGVDII